MAADHGDCLAPTVAVLTISLSTPTLWSIQASIILLLTGIFVGLRQNTCAINDILFSGASVASLLQRKTMKPTVAFQAAWLPNNPSVCGIEWAKVKWF